MGKTLKKKKRYGKGVVSSSSADSLTLDVTR